ncbi:MAG: head decoration protein [Propionibacteriaceae bacterium]|nr:head decoration protein [Propionibacteriaceae bacterium]
MDLGITTTVHPGGGDYRWLRSRHALDNTVSVTLPVSRLTAGIHYNAQGIIPSGLPLGKITGTDEWGPYDPAATDGRAVLAGFLLDPEQLQADFSGMTTQIVHAAMLVLGVVEPRFVPTEPVLTTKTPTTGQFVFFGVDYDGGN